MKPYPVKYRSVRDHGKTRCINPHCGKWTDLYQEKTCPQCGKISVVRADKRRCDDCNTLLIGGDPVCPLCGTKQRFIAELRSIDPENLTACAHLLHQAQPSMSLAECRKQCRSITAENPFRVPFTRKPEQIRPFLREWNALQGTAAACLGYETCRRPIVLIRSSHRRHTVEHVRLLSDAVRKSSCPSMAFGDIIAVLHDILRTGEPYRLRFTEDFDHIDAWVAAWRRLGGTAVRSPEHV